MTLFVTLDVRPMIASGQEPLSAIIAAADGLEPGQGLRLIAPFRPVPLLGLMQKRGFACAEQALDAADWQIDFTPAGPGLGEGSTLDAADWPEPVQLLDVTGLEAPQPMSRILEALAMVGPGEVVFALLDHEPLFLLPQLRSDGHAWVGNHAAGGAGYRLMVRRGAAA